MTMTHTTLAERVLITPPFFVPSHSRPLSMLEGIAEGYGILQLSRYVLSGVEEESLSLVVKESEGPITHYVITNAPKRGDQDPKEFIGDISERLNDGKNFLFFTKKDFEVEIQHATYILSEGFPVISKL